MINLVGKHACLRLTMIQTMTETRKHRSWHNWTQNEASAMAISVPWPEPVGWAEEGRAQERIYDSGWFCKEEWSQIPFSVFSNLIWCYRKRLCCFIGKGRLYKLLWKGANNGFVKKYNFLMRDSFSQNKWTSIKGWMFLFFQCEIKLIHQMVYFL